MHPVDDDVFTDCISSAEQLVFHFAAQECHPRTVANIGRGDPSSFPWDLMAHVAIFRTDSTHSGIDQPIAISDGKILDRFQAGGLHQGGLALHALKVGLFQYDLLTSALTSRL